MEKNLILRDREIPCYSVWEDNKSYADNIEKKK